MPNKIHPKKLLHSKWTKVQVDKKEKHFTVTHIKFDEEQNVIEFLIQAVLTKNDYSIDWRELKNSDNWRLGWK